MGFPYGSVGLVAVIAKYHQPNVIAYFQFGRLNLRQCGAALLYSRSFKRTKVVDHSVVRVQYLFVLLLKEVFISLNLCDDWRLCIARCEYFWVYDVGERWVGEKGL